MWPSYLPMKRKNALWPPSKDAPGWDPVVDTINAAIRRKKSLEPEIATRVMPDPQEVAMQRRRNAKKLASRGRAGTMLGGA